MVMLPTPEQVEYMTAHADDSLVSNIIAACAICGASSLVAIALRLIARRLTGQRLQLSDWLILAAEASPSKTRLTIRR